MSPREIEELQDAIIQKKAINEQQQQSNDIQSTLNQRKNTHGDFRDNASIMQALKATMRAGKNWDINLSTFQKEALEMIQHKIGRILSGNPDEPDHWHDIAGYATLVENILLTGQSHRTEQTKPAQDIKITF